MATIGLEAYFELDGIFCSPEVLGKSIEVTRDEVRCRLDIPKEQNDFEFIFAEVAKAPDPRDYHPTTALLKHNDNLCEIRLVRILVSTASQLSVVDFDGSNSEHKSAHDTLLNALTEAAVQLAVDFCNWVRVIRNQIWMEPPGRYPRLVSARRLVDLESKLECPYLLPPPIVAQVMKHAVLLASDDLAVISDKLLEPRSPTTEELFLMHARYLVYKKPDTHASDRAIVLAVIAAEARIKRALRTLATDEQSPLIELVIDKPRDWSISLHSLFKTALPEVVPGELPENHSELAKKLQKTIKRRNDIVHRGEHFDFDVANDDVGTVADVLDFLGEVTSSAAEGSHD